jgi:hypothetical protein
MSAKKKVITGRQLAVAAAKVAEVFIRAIPYMSKLDVILIIDQQISLYYVNFVLVCKRNVVNTDSHI